MVVCATLRPGASPGLGVQGGHPPCRGGVGGEEPPARPVALRALWTTCDTTRDAQWSEGGWKGGLPPSSEGSQGGAPPCGMPKGKALGCNVLRCIDHPHAKHDGWRGELASRSGGGGGLRAAAQLAGQWQHPPAMLVVGAVDGDGCGSAVCAVAPLWPQGWCPRGFAPRAAWMATPEQQRGPSPRVSVVARQRESSSVHLGCEPQAACCRLGSTRGGTVRTVSSECVCSCDRPWVEDTWQVYGP